MRPDKRAVLAPALLGDLTLTIGEDGRKYRPRNCRMAWSASTRTVPRPTPAAAASYRPVMSCATIPSTFSPQRGRPWSC